MDQIISSSLSRVEISHPGTRVGRIFGSWDHPEEFLLFSCMSHCSWGSRLRPTPQYTDVPTGVVWYILPRGSHFLDSGGLAFTLEFLAIECMLRSHSDAACPVLL